MSGAGAALYPKACYAHEVSTENMEIAESTGGFLARMSSSHVCVAPNLKVSNLQVYLSLQPKFYQADARHGFLRCASMYNASERECALITKCSFLLMCFFS